jgi:hypothetical protein
VELSGRVMPCGARARRIEEEGLGGEGRESSLLLPPSSPTNARFQRLSAPRPTPPTPWRHSAGTLSPPAAR